MREGGKGGRVMPARIHTGGEGWEEEEEKEDEAGRTWVSYYPGRHLSCVCVYVEGLVCV